MNNYPECIAIEHDEYAAKYIGRSADGRQFFLTTPFEPARARCPGCEFIALYLFDMRGQLLEAKIDSLGPRAEVDEAAARKLIKLRLQELGDISFQRIEIAPFTVERFGTKFGLIYEPENEVVEVHPGNYMAFFEPWDSGYYDT